MSREAQTRIRVAGEADVETLFAIRTSVRENHQSRKELTTLGITPESVRELLRSGARAWIAELDGGPVAFSMAREPEQTVFAMFVRPGYEGRGLGRALMAEAEAWLFAAGADEIWLTTGSDERLRAHGFYRHLGWVQAGLQPNGEVLYLKQRAKAAAPGRGST